MKEECADRRSGQQFDLAHNVLFLPFLWAASSISFVSWHLLTGERIVDLDQRILPRRHGSVSAADRLPRAYENIEWGFHHFSVLR